jgi:hypothetical protein
MTTPVSAYLDAALQPVAKPSGAASAMTGTASVVNEINFAIPEGRVIRSSSKGTTAMTVTIGKPVAPEAPPKRRKKGTAPAAVPVTQPKGGQALKMTVHTDILTNLVEPAKKPLGGA